MPFIYPRSYEVQAIMPELVARGREGRLGLDIMPPLPVNAAQVRWTQEDNSYGLQAMRGMDGAPTHVQRVGAKTYVYEPGVFGEYIDITETELTTRAGSAPVDTTPIDVQDLVVGADNLLVGREFDRMEASIWQVLTTGTLTIKLNGPHGQQVAYSDTYTIQTYTAATPWSTHATATPIRNFQSVQQMGLGRSVDFGAAATAYMNSVTSNNLLNNSNAADFGGRRGEGGRTLNNLNDFNSYLMSQNAPKVQVYDAGYLPDIDSTADDFVKFIPDGVVVVVGRRPGNAQVGNYQLTRNASNGFRPGSYRYVIDRANGGGDGGGNAEKRTPANIEIHRGHSGGPAIRYPSAVVVMAV